MATALWFVIQTLVERNVNVEEGCDRDVTTPGGLEMLSKQKRNSRKLLKFKPSPWLGMERLHFPA